MRAFHFKPSQSCFAMAHDVQSLDGASRPVCANYEVHARHVSEMLGC